MSSSNEKDLRDKLIGLGRNSMRKTYYAELLKEKHKLEEQNLLLQQEIEQRRQAEYALKHLNDALEDRILDRTQELEAMNDTLQESLRELKRAQEYLIQSEKMAALGGMVAGISHEINTPLGICVTTASYLQSQVEEIHRRYLQKTLSAREFRETIEDIRHAMEILTSNLLRSAGMLENFKMIAVDQSHYEYRKFRVKEYCGKILSNFQLELKKKDAQVVLECPEDLEVMGYPGVLTQLLTNLVMNSVIHGFPCAVAPMIRIRFHTDPVFLHLEYADNGCGMTQEQVAKAFDPFFTTKRGSGGSGLGLYIVYNLVTTRLAGTITLTSSLGQGVRFHIQTPLNHQIEEVE